MTIKEFVTACLSINNTDIELNTAKTIMILTNFIYHRNDKDETDTLEKVLKLREMAMEIK